MGNEEGRDWRFSFIDGFFSNYNIVINGDEDVTMATDKTDLGPVASTYDSS